MPRRLLNPNRPKAKADLANATPVRAMVRVTLSSSRGADGNVEGGEAVKVLPVPRARETEVDMEKKRTMIWDVLILSVNEAILVCLFH